MIEHVPKASAVIGPSEPLSTPDAETVCDNEVGARRTFPFGALHVDVTTAVPVAPGCAHVKLARDFGAPFDAVNDSVIDVGETASAPVAGTDKEPSPAPPHPVTIAPNATSRTIGRRIAFQPFGSLSNNGSPFVVRTLGVSVDAPFTRLQVKISNVLYRGKTQPYERYGRLVRVPIDGGPPGGDGSSDSIETTLDVETIVSNAPGTALYVYEFPSFNSDQYITDAYNKVVSDILVDTANSSFGGCDKDQTSDAKAWDSIAEQGASLGITFHASTGDGGSDDGCTEAPASGRNSPDVAFDANPIRVLHSTTAEVGTPSTIRSAVRRSRRRSTAPLKPKSIKCTAHDLKDGYGSGTDLFFHDITSGSNGEYSAKTGYDQVTGIGSMNVWNSEQKQ